jgi:hypothetical protein
VIVDWWRLMMLHTFANPLHPWHAATPYCKNKLGGDAEYSFRLSNEDDVCLMCAEDYVEGVYVHEVMSMRPEDLVILKEVSKNIISPPPSEGIYWYVRVQRRMIELIQHYVF